MAERQWLGYTDDAGVIFNALIGNSVAAGFVAFNAARAAKPLQLKMRYATCQNFSNGRKRKLLVGALTSGYWTGVSTTVNLIDADGVTRTYTVTGRVGERWTRLPH